MSLVLFSDSLFLVFNRIFVIRFAIYSVNYEQIVKNISLDIICLQIVYSFDLWSSNMNSIIKLLKKRKVDVL